MTAGLVALLLGALHALAPSQPPAGEQAPATLPVSQPADATTLFKRGVSAYDAHDYLGAIESFRAAYALSKAPEILFDMGQAYRALGDCRQAAANFAAFIAAATKDDPMLPAARARQAELGSCGVEATAAAPPKPANTTVAVPPRASGTTSIDLTARPTSPPGTPLRQRACPAVVGGTLTLAVAGLALGAAAWSTANTVENVKVWDPEAQRADERGRAYERAAMATLIGAGVLGAAAVATCWPVWREHFARPH